MKEKGFTAILVLILVLVLAVGGFYLSKILPFPIKTNKAPVRTTQSATAQAVNNGNPNIRVYPSLDGRYFFYIYFAKGRSDQCNYYVIDSEGYGYELSDVLKTDKIACSQGQGNITADAFKGWVDDHKFLIEETKGEIQVIDVNKFKVDRTYTYDPASLQFVGTNKSLRYWLFEKEPKYSYQVLDNNKNVVKDNITFNSNGQENYGFYIVLYDEVNDGYLFVSQSYSDEKVSYKFDFLSMQDLSFRNLLTTNHITVNGRGCSGNKLVSKPGEIIFASGCVVVDRKYLGQDGYIHIKP